MDKVFHFDSPREIYQADACVIACFDARFDLAIRKFLKRSGIVMYDMVKIPGSAKALASPECDADRDFVLRMIAVSVRLHGTSRVLLIGHNECGGYVGAPTATIAADLLKAAVVLQRANAALKVECYFADFDGIYQCGPAAVTATMAP
jgi:carbonic anhydrase